ncbi:MAG: preprotein translocase subunit SecG [Duncaniella sp.]|nr:preprotein translocase subunit SecG [Muribaculum sp.]MCM1254995.1 preprotein translocase subunit SecG [Duncaniella sp.]
MYVVLIILTLICAVLLICVVLVQKSKGGGLSSSFAGSNQIMGVRRTNSFIEKLTWSLAGIICVLAILSTFCMPKAINSTSSRVNAPAATEQTVPGDFNTPAPTAAPTDGAAAAAGDTDAAAAATEAAPVEAGE